jgi:hypothetical protein
MRIQESQAFGAPEYYRLTTEANMEQQKVIGDSILATKDTIFVLSQWLALLERWHALGAVDGDEFYALRCELRESGLWSWATEAGGHGIEALTELAISHVEPIATVNERLYR